MYVECCRIIPALAHQAGTMSTVQLFDALWACRDIIRGPLIVNGGATFVASTPLMHVLRRDLQYNVKVPLVSLQLKLCRGLHLPNTSFASVPASTCWLLYVGICV